MSFKKNENGSQNLDFNPKNLLPPVIFISKKQ